MPADHLPHHRPGLSTCSDCAGDTLGERDDHPGGQLSRLRELAESAGVRLTEVECLDVCESDVVVVRPDRECRRRGVPRYWMSHVAGEEATGDLAEWLAAGGPGHADPPVGLQLLRVDPPA